MCVCVHIRYKYTVQISTVPSDVLNLKSNETGNRLTLTWDPPKQPNGKIVRYEVVLKVSSNIFIPRNIINWQRGLILN